MLEYVKPKVVFNMVHNSSGLAKEEDFKYQIPSVNDTKPVKVHDILFYDWKFMSFDYSTQTIIFHQHKVPIDMKGYTLRFSKYDL